MRLKVVAKLEHIQSLSLGDKSNTGGHLLVAL